MIKKICVMAAISVLAISIVACSNDGKQDPSTETSEEVVDIRPTLNLLYQQDDKEITSAAARGGYSFTIDNGDGTKTSEKTDSAHILQWSEELIPVVVMDNSSQTLKITLQFNKKATDCKIIAWEEKYFGNDTDVQVSNGKEIEVLHEEDGDDYFVEVSPDYIYEVKAEGEEWSADFGFKIGYGELPVKEKVSLYSVIEGIGVKHQSKYPLSMEQVGQNYGYIMYRSRSESIRLEKELDLG